MNKSNFRIPAIVLLGGALGACATVPQPLQGQYANVTAREAAGSVNGQNVRWGGDIIKVEPKADITCFEVLSRKLDSSARPLSRDPTDGRFIACRSGFYDPEEFERGREVTIAGRLTGTDRGKVGEYDYSYPHVAADTIYLWPKRPLVVRDSYDPWRYGYGPYGPWGWGGPYWGPFWGGGGTLIIRDHGHPRGR